MPMVVKIAMVEQAIKTYLITASTLLRARISGLILERTPTRPRMPSDMTTTARAALLVVCRLRK